jgi:hypothetical protein
MIQGLHQASDHQPHRAKPGAGALLNLLVGIGVESAHDRMGERAHCAVGSDSGMSPGSAQWK